MQTTLLALAAAITLGQTSKPAQPGAVTLSGCLVSLIEEVKVPAQQPGVLADIYVEEGKEVQKGERLAQIDDSDAQVAKTIALRQLAVAQETAENDVDIRVARAAANVVEAEYLEGVEANREVPGTVTESELRRRLFQVRRAELDIEQYEFELRTARLTQDVRAAELEKADNDIEKRRIKAPIDGTVVAVYPHKGEWLQPGDPILRIVGMKRLRVEGFVRAADYPRETVAGCKVRVEMRMSDGSVETFPSHISFVNPENEASGEYRVWAEVENRKIPGGAGEKTGHWILHPRQRPAMIILLNEKKRR